MSMFKYIMIFFFVVFVITAVKLTDVMQQEYVPVAYEQVRGVSGIVQPSDSHWSGLAVNEIRWLTLPNSGRCNLRGGNVLPVGQTLAQGQNPYNKGSEQGDDRHERDNGYDAYRGALGDFNMNVFGSQTRGQVVSGLDPVGNYDPSRILTLNQLLNTPEPNPVGSQFPLTGGGGRTSLSCGEVPLPTFSLFGNIPSENIVALNTATFGAFNLLSFNLGQTNQNGIPLANITPQVAVPEPSVYIILGFCLAFALILVSVRRKKSEQE